MAALDVDLRIRSEEVKSLSDIVYEKLKKAIIAGSFPKGEKLSERKLAKELGTSPMPVKQALGRLQSEGYLHIVPRKGIFLNYHDEVSFDEFFQIKASLNSLAARFAAEKASSSELAEISKTITQMNDHLDKDDTAGLLNAFKEFHDQIIGASHNQMLQNMLAVMRTHTLEMRKVVYKNKSEAISATTEHKNIFKAIQARMLDKAEQLMKEHVQMHKKRLQASSTSQKDKSQEMRVVTKK